jgi:hypothetical protein
MLRTLRYRRRFAPLTLLMLILASPMAGTPQAAHAAAQRGYGDYYGPNFFYNRWTDRCIDLPGHQGGQVNGPVKQYPCEWNNLDSDHLFYQVDSGTLAWNTYTVFAIRNVLDGLCLDVPNYGIVAAGTIVSEYWCNYTSGDNQLFYAEPRYNEFDEFEGAWIVHRKTGLCLDIEGHRSGDFQARVTLFYCSDDDDHHWWITRERPF